VPGVRRLDRLPRLEDLGKLAKGKGEMVHAVDLAGGPVEDLLPICFRRGLEAFNGPVAYKSASAGCGQTSICR
jgi:hypothetical protein